MQIGDLPANSPEESWQRVHLQLAVSRRFVLDSSWNYDLHSPFWRLYVHNRYGAELRQARGVMALKPNRLYLIPSWVRFQTSARNKVLQDYLHFYIAGLPPAVSRKFFNQPLLLPRALALDQLCTRWRTGFDSPSDFESLMIATSLAYAAFAGALASLSETGRQACFHAWVQTSPIRAALDCIDQRLARPPKNPELARLCHLSTDRFIRKFNLTVGMTPAQYGLERRIAIASQWLTSTTRTIEEIASASGFTDRFHFSRVFRTRLKIPPAAYRRLHRRAIEEKISVV